MVNTFNISNRRYLGNKYKLLEWIKRIVEENCTDVNSFFDVFSGTGSVASAFQDKRLVVCDMMRSNYYAALCWFSPENIDREKLTQLMEYYNAYDTSNVGHREMNKEELKALGYPNKNPRKCYMTFTIEALDMDLSLLVNHRLIERLIEINPENVKGTPVFIEP